MGSAEAVYATLVGLIPYWFAAMAGLLIGWSWCPRWAAALVFLAVRCRSRFVWTAPPGLGARRFWFALTALSAFSLLNRFFRRCRASSKDGSLAVPQPSVVCPSFSDADNEQVAVTEEDLETLMSYIDGTDGGPSWQLMMERSTASLQYQAWHRDPEFGPTQYRTRIIFENASPDLIRDFFWDDEFRTKWDNMLIYFRTLHECPSTGAMIVHWIRKFPFFCSNREYIIVRRIWESGSTYYCVTKGTPYPSVQRHGKLKRVDLYFSSWSIEAVETRNGQMTSSEVVLFHHEEMGIPRELAKIGIQREMWSLVKKMDAGVHAYQMERANGAPLSRYALMARINTKIPSRSSLPESEPSDTCKDLGQVGTCQNSKQGGNAFKWLVIAGVSIVCGGAIGKGIAFGILRGFKRVDRKDKQEPHRDKQEVG